MSLEILIKEYAGYNLWANTKLANWLSPKPAALFDSAVPSSYPSLGKTILHIWDSQSFWLSFLSQTDLHLFRKSFEGTHIELLNGLTTQSKEFCEFIDTLSEKTLIEKLTINNPWAKGIRPKFDYIHHCLNHSTYHRGQIITIARTLGMTDPPNTDFNFYVLGLQQY